MLKAQITVEDESNHFVKLFASEDKEFPNQRAQFSLKNSKGKTVFDVEATDSTAFRAVLNSITKTLIVYEKAKAIKNE